MICSECGREYTPTHGNSRYCSRECRDKHSGRITYNRGTIGTCKYCGQTFKKIYGSEVYCTVECREIATKENKKENRKVIHPPRECKHCGKTFMPTNGKQIYCCKTCADNHKYCDGLYGQEREQRKKENRSIAAKKREDTRRKTHPPKPKLESKWYTGTCKVCGKEFTTRNPRQKTCSKECGKRLSNARKQHRIPKEQIIDKDITLESLYKRDSGVCYLCGGVCDWSDKDTEKNTVGANYPSIDHIVPISRGGLHSWGNVRLAHFRCNVQKSDTLIERAEDLTPNNAYEFKRDVKPQRKEVSQYTKRGDFVATYPSTAEAERKTGIPCKSVQECACGRRKTGGGYVWKYGA